MVAEEARLKIRPIPASAEKHTPNSCSVNQGGICQGVRRVFFAADAQAPLVRILTAGRISSIVSPVIYR